MSRDRCLDVAVTGMFARLPGPAEFDRWWAAIRAGQVLTTRLDRAYLSEAGVPESRLADPDYVPVRGYLADADCFDHELFGVSPREAELTDPQHRLMLEAAWSALEDAGRDPTHDRLRTAVYASSSSSAYLRRMLLGGALSPEALDLAVVAAGRDYMASRIAYKLGLTGPAVNVLTACSSSLVAVHMAVQALINGDCDQAVVVAAAVDFPQAGHLHVRGGIMSATGACRPFDAHADGSLSGSGVAAVVLRRLDDTAADGDSPHGVILGSATNNDGSAKAGFNAPSARGQQAVIRAALRAAAVPAESLGYLEGHATGTYVGDPIEWSAASAALGELGVPPGRIAVGALKANIGHLDAASGLASLVKTLMVVKDGVLPPLAGFTRLNPLLAGEDSPLFVPTEPGPWRGPVPRRAAVSSFGIGGTNAHVILEQPPERPVAAGLGVPRETIVVVSAADPGSLRRCATRLSAHLAEHDAALPDVAYTLAAGRAALPSRLAVVGRTCAEVAERLAQGTGRLSGARPAPGPGPLIFLLPGQGAQRPGMAVAFQAVLPGFGAALEECLAAMQPSAAALVRAALLDPAFPAGRLERTELAQPALFALEYAVVQALRGLALTPAALAGHSLGEITSACLAGVLDLPAAVRLVATRARAMQACPPGAMLVLGCAEPEAHTLLAEADGAGHRAGLEIAAVNSADSCVVAGPVAAVAAFQRRVGDRVPCRRLRTSHGFHCALIEPAVRELRQELATLRAGRPVLPFVANATGTLVQAGDQVDLAMFAEGARRAVRFGAGLAALAERFPGATAVEAGPGQALTGMAVAAGLTAVALAPARSADPGSELLQALGALWVEGQPVDLARLHGPGRRVHLPAYPFAGPRRVAPEAGVGQVCPPVRDAGAGEGAAGEGAAAATPRSRVTAMWAELLGYRELTDSADFFGLGGDSLIIIRLARRLGQDLAVEIPIRELLAARTLGGQIGLVERLVAGRRPTPGRSVPQDAA